MLRIKCIIVYNLGSQETADDVKNVRGRVENCAVTGRHAADYVREYESCQGATAALS